MGYHNVRGADGRFAPKSTAKTVKVGVLKVKKVKGLDTPTFKNNTVRVSKAGGKTKHIYHVLILDDSSSMRGEKSSAARDAYNNHIQELRKTATKLASKNTKVQSSLWIFSGSQNINEESSLREPSLSPLLASSYQLGMIMYPKSGGMTALVQAICVATNKMEAFVNANHRGAKVGKDIDVVITVFTDGDENASGREYHDAINPLLNRLQGAGWTFAFMGLGNEQDVRRAAQSYGYFGSNTIAAADNSGGVGQTMAAYSVQTMSRAANYASKGSVNNVGFFSDDK